MIIPTSQKGVELRVLKEEHALDYFLAVEANQEHLSQFGDETATKYPTLRSVWESISEPSNPDKLRFGIWDEGQFVGSANITPEDGCAEVDYWLDSSFTGNGYATLAVSAIATHALKIDGVSRVFARVAEGNEASVRVLERAGFDKTERTLDTSEQIGRIVFEYTRNDIDALADEIDEIEAEYERSVRGEELKAYHETYNHFSLLDLEVGDELKVRMKSLDGVTRNITTKVSPLPLASYAEVDQIEALSRAVSSHRALLEVIEDDGEDNLDGGQLINLGTNSGILKMAGGDLVFERGGLLRSYVHRDGAVTIDSAGMHFVNEGSDVEILPMLWDGLWVNGVTVIEPSEE